MCLVHKHTTKSSFDPEHKPPQVACVCVRVVSVFLYCSCELKKLFRNVGVKLSCFTKKKHCKEAFFSTHCLHPLERKILLNFRKMKQESANRKVL